MKLEDQVCSLELAKKLKELGVRGKGLFAYYANPYHGGVGAKFLLWEHKEDGYPMKSFSAFAFTATELGEMLPAHYISYWQIKNEDMEKEWFCEYLDENKYKRCSSADTEANARAKMLIHLLENHLISVKELGK